MDHCDERAGFPFNVSCDNLHGDLEPDRLALRIKYTAKSWVALKLAVARVKMLSEALRSFYDVEPFMC